MTDDPAPPTAPIRRRTTSWRVRAADRASSVVITLGGLAVVVAVLGIGVYLVAVTIPLFAGGTVDDGSSASLGGPASPLFVDEDESRAVALRLFDDGRLSLARTDTGEVIDERTVTPAGSAVSAFVRAPRGGHVAFGYADGRVQLGMIGFRMEFLPEGAEPESLRDLAPGERRAFEGAIAERTPIGQVRLTRASVDLSSPAVLRSGSGEIVRLDYRVGASQRYVAALRADGTVALNEVRIRPNLAGGPPRVSLRTHTVPSSLITRAEPPMDLFILGDGYSLLLIWEDGFAERLVTEDPAAPVLGETLRLVADGRRVTALATMIGSHTVVVGDSAGGVSGWFAARAELAETPDGRVFVEAHRLAPQDAAITSVGVSTRDRTIVTGDASGSAWVRNVTAETVVARVEVEPASAIVAARLAPKVDGVALLTASGGLHTWSLDAPHPDGSVRALFGKVWYEGDPAPSYTYQSSSGDDAAEAKYNLVPLIFGTLKATLYTMIIAAPLGILGAIYTSEFLSPRVRAAVKPSIEMMASLPSVVLGFIAAMLIAPMVRDALPGVLLGFVGVPVGVLLAAHLWHFAPVRVMSRLSAGGRLVMIMGVTVVGAWVSIGLGPAMESLLFRPSETDVLIRAGAYEPVPREEWPGWFAELSSVSAREVRLLRDMGLSYRDGEVVRPAGGLGDPAIAARVERYGFDEPDLRAWLDGVIGGPWPGWFLLLFPASALVTVVGVTRVVDPAVRAWDREHSPTAEAAMELGKFVVALGVTALVAAGGAAALTGLGLDARDSIFGTFQQRNTLVVGLAMAVAVIPIIYTIADDAMTSVPDSMRSASLGAGATRWQTAVRVVLPVALSGVFSACMIGLGRAAGETMIVLMATGNTPIMSWSLFDGLRTLSANIAVELPEAPKDGTHYRVLFLCGLALFALTFTINTAAEIIRQRVRKRSASL